MVIQKIESHIVPKLESSIRIQEYGVGIFNSLITKSALKKALKKKCISVDGKTATSATFISGGEEIVLNIPEEIEPSKKLVFPLKVLFEDDYLAVIHKPAGVLVSGNSFKTIAHALAQNLKESSLADACCPQPVHRLDYPTTGALLIGKTNSSIRELNKLFENKQIEKTYYAVTIGEMNNEGTITSDVDDKPAESHYTLCSTVPSPRFGKLNLVKLKPKTGRKHQLRIHLASIGNPILGDKNYGIEKLILNGKGLYLHAYSLEFIHPFTKENLFIKDEIMERFQKIFPAIE